MLENSSGMKTLSHKSISTPKLIMDNFLHSTKVFITFMRSYKCDIQRRSVAIPYVSVTSDNYHFITRHPVDFPFMVSV